MNAVIHFDNVSKQYRVGRAIPSIRSLLSNRGNDNGKSYHWAVKDVSFSLQRGQSLGIIGPNGAGKTTILKLLSRVTFPTSGQINVNGRLSALIELGAGFHPDLTGRENIFLNGTILGMRRAEIDEQFDDIVDFAGIGNYLDTPVKRYSSGMYARLGFAVAAHVDPEVLLVDEVLAVGDMAFQKKCYDRMKQMISRGTTLIFVSHNMRAVQEVCERCIVLYRGHAAFEGPTAQATAEYSNILRKAATERQYEGEVESGISQRVMTHDAVIEDVQLENAAGQSTLTFDSGQEARVRVQVSFKRAAPAPIFAIAIRQPDGRMAFNFTTHWSNVHTPDFSAGTIAEIEYALTFNLTGGTYQLGVDLAYSDLSRYYDRIDRALDFVIIGDGTRGVANLNVNFRVKDIQTVLETDSVIV